MESVKNLLLQEATSKRSLAEACRNHAAASRKISIEAGFNAIKYDEEAAELERLAATYPEKPEDVVDASHDPKPEGGKS